MASAAPKRFDFGRLTDLAERLSVSFDELLGFLDSPAGRRMRRATATGIIVSLPFVMRIPGLRRSGVGRAIELVGGTAIIVRLAEALRDWERSGAPRPSRGPVVDVPPAP